MKAPIWRVLLEATFGLTAAGLSLWQTFEGHWDQATYWLVLAIFEVHEIRRLTGKQ